MHWYSWERLCTPKYGGGLGFWKIICFNQLLLGKQVWRLLFNPSYLAFNVLRSKYFVRGGGEGNNSPWYLGFLSVIYLEEFYMRNGISWQGSCVENWGCGGCKCEISQSDS